jgi:hypothetical protein
VYTVVVRVATQSDNATALAAALIAAIASISGGDVFLDPNYEPSLRDGILVVPLHARSAHTLSVTGGSLTAVSEYSVPDSDDLFFFGDAHLFDTRAARCINGTYPVMADTNNTVYPPHYGGASEYTQINTLNASLPCYQFACADGYGGENCAVVLSSGDSSKLNNGQIIGIVLGCVFGVFFVFLGVIWGNRRRRTEPLLTNMEDPGL